MYNCTFESNIAPEGGAVYVAAESSIGGNVLVMISCIVHNNRAVQVRERTSFPNAA